ncbi:sodium-coupled monocarboxylate transporter 1-like [Haliotis rubra]|uniref:sodium-coupled monocarboxylate transporter 1-like n=1 Tax=Haliotis rubra TaxID=36100 RepID=UPI001EE52A19|nr:sodium-coupled monocarboxylate transporter 1-like [Haliotis rubra]
MAAVNRSFGSADYAVFVTSLVLSAVVGIFYACKGGRQKTTGEFLMGNRDLQILPVSLSILVSFLSAITILGTVAEMYTNGTEYFLYVFGMVFGIILATVLYIPLFYPHGFTSSFEYLEKRFNSRAAKLTGTAITIFQQIIYMGIASYAPSTALEAVTGFPVWAAIVTVGVVSCFYTVLGGLKAVVWTDLFQTLVIVAGLLAVVIQGTMLTGSIGDVWRINYEWGRINFFDFDPSPTTRHTFWSLVVGGTIAWTGTYGVNQASIQRFCAVPTLKKARISLLMNAVGVLLMLTILCLAGITIFAYYAIRGCDPLSAKYIGNSNQLLPYFVMEVLDYPGVPGLFIACLFSGTLSTLSPSCLSAVTAVVWEDMLKPFLEDRLSEGHKTIVAKILVLIFGGAGTAMAFMAKNLGGTVLQAALSFAGAATGPLMGMFALGAFFPWANWIGAVVGGVCGLAFPLWLGIGAYTVVGSPPVLAYPTSNCSFSNITTIAPSTAATTLMTDATTPMRDSPTSGLTVLYSISYLWYTPIGTATVIIVGLLVSVLTGMNRVGDVDTKYMVPFFDRLICCLPSSISRVLRCNQEFDSPEVLCAQAKELLSVEQKIQHKMADHNSLDTRL